MEQETHADTIDYRSRTLPGVARIFEYFAADARQVGGDLYTELSSRIAHDPELLALAAIAPPTQPPPNLLFGAVHYLLLQGAEHPLREFYANLARGKCQPTADAMEPFADFCRVHRGEIATLISEKMTQTNIVKRSMLLLPAFATVFERGGRKPLALIEIGPSAGLNLQWYRFHYTFTPESKDLPPTCWGDPSSGVVLETQLRGASPLPALREEMKVSWRRGIDLNPIDLEDPDAVTWLRALIWPEHVERHERLARGIEIARTDPPNLIRGDAATGLRELIDQAPRDATLCIYGTFTLYQFPKEALRAVFHGMQAAAADRTIHFVGCEGTGDECSELRLTTYEGEGREKFHLADCNPHAQWLQWVGTV